MSKRRIRIISISIVLIFVIGMLMGLVSDAFSVANTEKARLKELKAQMSEKSSERKKLDEELSALKAEKSSLLDRKVAVEREINATMDLIDLSGEIIEELTAEISYKEKELAAAQTSEKEQYETFKTRVRAMYENDSLSELELVLKAGSLTEALARFEATTYVAGHDKKLMKRLAETRQYIEDLKTGLESDLAQQQEIKQEREEYERELSLQNEQLVVLIEQIDERTVVTEEEKQAIMDAEAKFQKEIDELTRQIAKAEEEERKRKEAEEAKKAEAARLEAQNSSSSSSDSGSMMWPLPGYSYISSGYKMRNHPITGVYGQHSGIDIPAPKGTKVYATKAGTVVSVGYNSVFGNRVIVSHGNGIQTLYAHLSKISVKENQSVTTKTVIGLVGSTGYSTGNHLHLSVLKDGSYVNPNKYVSP